MKGKESSPFFLGYVCSILCVLLFAGCPESDLKGQSKFCADPDVFKDLGIPLDAHNKIGSVDQPLLAEQDLIWPAGERMISVCWEPESWRDEDSENRRIVKKTIHESWERVLSRLDNGVFLPDVSKQVHFTGWGKCTDVGADIRIYVADTRPESIVGTDIQNKRRGMVLNFEFKKWDDNCSRSEALRQLCLKRIVLHEFGHALGLEHEQDRVDTPKKCIDSLDPHDISKDGDYYGGPWDANSVMNYCSSDLYYNGKLPPGDVYWVRSLYTPEYYDENYECISLKEYAKYIK